MFNFLGYEVKSCSYEIEIAGKKYKVSASVEQNALKQREARITMAPPYHGQNTFVKKYDGSRLLSSIAVETICNLFRKEGYFWRRIVLVHEESVLTDESRQTADLSIDYQDNVYHADITFQGNTVQGDYLPSGSLEETLVDLEAKLSVLE